MRTCRRTSVSNYCRQLLNHAEQDQIGEQERSAPSRFPGRSLEPGRNPRPRGMAAALRQRRVQKPAYSPAGPFTVQVFANQVGSSYGQRTASFRHPFSRLTLATLGFPFSDPRVPIARITLCETRLVFWLDADTALPLIVIRLISGRAVRYNHRIGRRRRSQRRMKCMAFVFMLGTFFSNPHPQHK